MLVVEKGGEDSVEEEDTTTSPVTEEKTPALPENHWQFTKRKTSGLKHGKKGEKAASCRGGEKFPPMQDVNELEKTVRPPLLLASCYTVHTTVALP